MLIFLSITVILKATNLISHASISLIHMQNESILIYILLYIHLVTTCISLKRLIKLSVTLMLAPD